MIYYPRREGGRISRARRASEGSRRLTDATTRGCRRSAARAACPPRSIAAAGSTSRRVAPDQGTTETPLFAMPFYTKNDHFTKTGSGQHRESSTEKEMMRFLAGEPWECIPPPLLLFRPGVCVVYVPARARGAENASF
jgi:hypothetical protein